MKWSWIFEWDYIVSPNNPRFALHFFLKDLYWRNIPPKCRYCDYIEDCRTGWLNGRKCRNGCLILNTQREYKRERDREDYIDSLLDYVDNNVKSKK